MERSPQKQTSHDAKKDNSEEDSSTGDTEDSDDELAYNTPAEGEEWGGRLGMSIVFTIVSILLPTHALMLNVFR